MSEFELKTKDKDILFELSCNARISITELAKKVKLSKQVVSYRLKLLEENNIILGYYAITNIYKLGKVHYRVFIKYQNMSTEKEKEIINDLSNDSEISWVAQFDGNLDLGFIIWAENIIEFQKKYDEINDKYANYFQEKYFTISTRIEYLKYKFFNNKKDRTSLIFGDSFDNIKLDKLDKNILNDLNKNGRITLVELANKYNSSAKVINERIKKLIKNKIIIGFNVKINHNKLGYSHRKVMLKLNNCSKKEIEKLSSYLKELKNTIFLVKPIWNYDFEFELMTKSNEEFHKIIKKLRSNFANNIKSYNTVIHYSEPKSGQSTNF